MTVDESDPSARRGRFAPSTTGEAHPGTLLAALLCWLDARSAGAEVVLRLEDLDRARTKPGYVDQLDEDLAWFGLDWDRRTLQSQAQPRHEAALDALAEAGRVYACDCSRRDIRASGRLAPDGSFAYEGTCRSQRVTVATWRTDPRPLRLDLAADPLTVQGDVEGDFQVDVQDESGVTWSGDAATLFGDPILRRRDGAYAYHFVSVLDDAEAGVGHVVRGRDLGPATVLQVALQRALGVSTPTYRHHCLFLERRGEKLSKLHGAVGMRALRQVYTAEQLCGRLASLVGLVPSGVSCRPVDLVSAFDWAAVSPLDIELKWSEGEGLARVGESEDARMR